MVEHSATRELCAQLAKEGAEIVEVEVDGGGAIDLDELSAQLTDDTALATADATAPETGGGVT